MLRYSGECYKSIMALLLNIIKLQIPERNLHTLCFKVLIKNLNKKKTNSNDITACCIVGYKYSIVGYISIYSN